MEDLKQKELIERIIILRKKFGGDRGKSTFARALGISASTYSYYEQNRIPPIELLLKMCEITGTDIEWLLTGKTAAPASLAGPYSPILSHLAELFATNPETIEPIMAFVELLCEKKGLESHPNSTPPQNLSPRKNLIPILGRTAAGVVHYWNETIATGSANIATELSELVEKHLGKNIVSSANGTISVDLPRADVLANTSGRSASLIQIANGNESDSVTEFIDCPSIYETQKDCFALRIAGDSMSPRINDGDAVIASPSAPPSQGQIPVVKIVNQIGVTCKLIRFADEKIHLVPINE